MPSLNGLDKQTFLPPHSGELCDFLRCQLILGLFYANWTLRKLLNLSKPPFPRL